MIDAARAAYGIDATTRLVAAPGTQVLIQLVARLRAESRVGVVGPTYSEHAIAWRREGAVVTHVADLDAVEHAQRGAFDVVVVVNPNNPDGRTFPATSLAAIADRQASHGGLLIVDEAFADVVPEISVAGQAGRPGLIVLRSFGKFYGLAGLRLGFAAGTADDIQPLEGWLGPWAVAGPAIEIGQRALRDRLWASKTRTRIIEDSAWLHRQMTSVGLTVPSQFHLPSLFVLGRHDRAAEIAASLARKHILVRTFDYAPCWLRIGLPAPPERERVAAALIQATADL